MNRAAKQFVYGAGYVAFFALIAFAAWGTFLKQPPTCTDGVQNQNETGVDCGGSCIACAIKALAPLAGAGEPRVLTLPNGKSVVLLEAQNPNPSYHANSFGYTVTVRDLNQVKLESFSGTDTLFAGETRILFEPRITARANNIGSIELSFDNPKWRSAEEFIAPSLSVSGVSTTVSGASVRVDGTVKNGSALRAKEVRLLAIVHDQFGYELFASQTTLTSLEGFAETPFSIPFPPDADFASRVDAPATSIFVYSR